MTETLKHYATASARLTVKLTVASVQYTWKTTLWVAALLWRITKFAGRVTLWIVFWPAGLFRSWKRSSKKQNEALIQALKERG